jgi:hypothetical protein
VHTSSFFVGLWQGLIACSGLAGFGRLVRRLCDPLKDVPAAPFLPLPKLEEVEARRRNRRETASSGVNQWQRTRL